LIRAGFYHYRYAGRGEKARWTRTRLDDYLPPIARATLEAAVSR